MISRSLITGGNFPHVNGDYHVNNHHYHINQNTSHDAGIQALSQMISHGAMHDSSERYPPPKCHPGTREKIIKTILDWINDPDPEHDVVWVYGLVGVGKSAIMQAIADWLNEHKIVSASFFFGREAPGRNKAYHLIPTIAYQIATNFPGMREHINDAMIRDPILPTKSIDIQLQSLIVAPFSLCSVRDTTAIVIIDGLDECEGFDGQRAVLDIVGNALAVQYLPLRFLIASRPEPQICSCFRQSPLSDLLCWIEVGSDDDDNEEIALYLTDGFDKIYKRFSYIMSSVAKPWPSHRDFLELLRRASGQFLYASTVLEFIGAERHNPVKQLEVILAPHPRHVEAFSNIDYLYTQILDTCPYKEDLLHILGMMVQSDFMAIESGVIGDIFDLKQCEIAVVLNGLQSLVVTEPSLYSSPDMSDWTHEERSIYSHPSSPKLRIKHLSFHDFLLEKPRAGLFYIDCDAVDKEKARRSDTLIRETLSRRLKNPLCIITQTLIYHKYVDINSMDCYFPLVESVSKSLESFKTFCWRSAHLVGGLQSIVSVAEQTRTSSVRPHSNLHSLCLKVLDDIYRVILLSSPSVISLAQGAAMVREANIRMETTFRRSGLALESIKATLKDPMAICLFNINLDRNGHLPVLSMNHQFEKFLLTPENRSGCWGAQFRTTSFAIFQKAWKDLQGSLQENSVDPCGVICYFLDPDFYQDASDAQNIFTLFYQTGHLSWSRDLKIQEAVLRWMNSRLMSKDLLYDTTTITKERWETLFALLAIILVSLETAPITHPGWNRHMLETILHQILPPDDFTVPEYYRDSELTFYRQIIPECYRSLLQCLRCTDVSHPSVTRAHCYAKIAEFSIHAYANILFDIAKNDTFEQWNNGRYYMAWTKDFFESELKWEEHMSQTCTSHDDEILLGCKVIYYLLVERGVEKKYQPPVTFFLGILAFLRNQAESCEYLRDWCKEKVARYEAEKMSV